MELCLCASYHPPRPLQAHRPPLLPAAVPILALLAAFQLAHSPDSVPGRGAPTFEAPRIEAEVSMDGQLDEPAWRSATRLTGFHGYQPTDGRPAEEETEILIWYSPTALYVGVVARDRDPASVRASLADRDRIDQEDRVTLFLDTFLDRRRAFFFSVNPLGVQQDGVRSEGSATAGNMFGGNTDLNPDYAWSSQGRRTEWGWQAEIRIPFTSLRYPSGDSQKWGINVTRNVQRTGHEDVWTDAARGANSFLGQSATMTGLHGLKRGVVVETQPFVTASMAGARDPLTDRFDREAMETNVGANLRLGFASISLDATINPDFSQVESDAGLVTANERFSLFVAERRPFFLEGIELFAAPNQLVYTRRIVDPVGGAKVTGKLGRWGVAYLSALDDQGAGRDDALFNVLRLRRDIGSGSTIGIVATDRRDDVLSNSVVAADARIVFGGKYYVQGQLGASVSDAGPGAGTGAIDGTGAIYSAEFDRTGRHWGFNYKLNQMDEDFVAGAGFVPRVGVTTGSANNRLSWLGAPGAAVERVNFFGGPSRIWNAGEFGRAAAIEGDESISITPRFRGGWEIQFRAERGFVNFDPSDYAGWTTGAAGGDGQPTAFVPASGLTNLWALELELTTPVFQRVNGSLSIETAEVPLFNEAAEGREKRATLSAALRPMAQLRVDASTVFSRHTRARDGSEFARTVIPRVRVEYQPTRALFFRTVAEYRAERAAPLLDPRSGAPILVGGQPRTGTEHNGLRLEWLASYQPTPGTVAFLGYAVDLAEPSPLAFDRLRSRGDGIFVKLAYQFRN